MAGTFDLRDAEPGDEPAILALIHELAAYENLTDQVSATAQDLTEQLFGDRPAAQAWVAVLGATAQVVGYAICCPNFSTFLAKPGLYLEDLYVAADQRGQGIGRAFLVHLAAVALSRGYGRFEWAVLDWNTPAIGFYESMGAVVMPDWRICRVSGPALVDLAGAAGVSPA